MNKLRSLFIIFLLIMSPIVSAQANYDYGTAGPFKSRLNQEKDEPEIAENSLLIYNVTGIEPELLYVVPVGRDPRHVVVSPNDRYLYVTNSKSNTVSVVDRATLSQTGQIKVGKGPEDIDISPDGSFLLVANMDPDGEELYGHITYINTSNYSTRKIPLFAPPSSVSITSNGKEAYYTEFGTNQVGIVDIKKMQPFSDTKLGTGPIHIKTLSNGQEVILTTYISNEIWVPKANLMTTRLMKGYKGFGPHDIALSPEEDRFLVSDFNLGIVSEIWLNNLTNKFVYNTAERRAIDVIYNPRLINETPIAYTTTRNKGYVKVINVSSGEELASKKSGDYLHGQAMSKDNMFLYVVNGEGIPPEEAPPGEPGMPPEVPREMLDVGVLSRTAHMMGGVIPRDELPWVFYSPASPGMPDYPAQPPGEGEPGAPGAPGAPEAPPFGGDGIVPEEDLPSGDAEYDEGELTEISKKFNLYPMLGTVFKGVDIEARSDLVMMLEKENYMYLTAMEAYIGRKLEPFEKHILREYFKLNGKEKTGITGALITDQVHTEVVEETATETVTEEPKTITEPTITVAGKTFETNYIPACSPVTCYNEEVVIETVSNGCGEASCKNKEDINPCGTEPECTEGQKPVYKKTENDCYTKVCSDETLQTVEEEAEELDPIIHRKPDDLLYDIYQSLQGTTKPGDCAQPFEPPVCLIPEEQEIEKEMQGKISSQQRIELKKELEEMRKDRKEECEEKGGKIGGRFDAIRGCFSESDCVRMVSHEEEWCYGVDLEELECPKDMTEGEFYDKEEGCWMPDCVYESPPPIDADIPTNETMEDGLLPFDIAKTDAARDELLKTKDPARKPKLPELPEDTSVCSGVELPKEKDPCPGEGNWPVWVLEFGEGGTEVSGQAPTETPPAEETPVGITPEIMTTTAPELRTASPTETTPTTQTMITGMSAADVAVETETTSGAAVTLEPEAIVSPEAETTATLGPETIISSDDETTPEQTPDDTEPQQDQGEAEGCAPKSCMRWACSKDLEEQAKDEESKNAITMAALDAAIPTCESAMAAIDPSTLSSVCFTPKKAEMKPFAALEKEIETIGKFAQLTGNSLAGQIGRAREYVFDKKVNGYAKVMEVWEKNIPNRAREEEHMKKHDAKIAAASNNIYKPFKLKDDKACKDARKELKDKLTDLEETLAKCGLLPKAKAGLDGLKAALGELDKQEERGIMKDFFKALQGLDASIGALFGAIDSKLAEWGDPEAIEAMLSELDKMDLTGVPNSKEYERAKKSKVALIAQLQGFSIIRNEDSFCNPDGSLKETIPKGKDTVKISDLDAGTRNTFTQLCKEQGILNAGGDFNDLLRGILGEALENKLGISGNGADRLKAVKDKLKSRTNQCAGDKKECCDKLKELKKELEKAKKACETKEEKGARRDSILGHIMGLMPYHNDLVTLLFYGSADPKQQGVGLLGQLSMTLGLYAQYQFFTESARDLARHYFAFILPEQIAKEGKSTVGLPHGGEVEDALCKAENKMDQIDDDATEENFFDSLKEIMGEMGMELGMDMTEDQLAAILQDVEDEDLFTFFEEMGEKTGWLGGVASSADIADTISGMTGDELMNFLNEIEEAVEETTAEGTGKPEIGEGAGAKPGLSAKGIDPHLQEILKMKARAGKTKRSLEEMLKKLDSEVMKLIYPLSNFEEDLKENTPYQAMLRGEYVARVQDPCLICKGLPCGDKDSPCGHVTGCELEGCGELAGEPKKEEPIQIEDVTEYPLAGEPKIVTAPSATATAVVETGNQITGGSIADITGMQAAVQPKLEVRRGSPQKQASPILIPPKILGPKGGQWCPLDEEEQCVVTVAVEQEKFAEERTKYIEDTLKEIKDKLGLSYAKAAIIGVLPTKACTYFSSLSIDPTLETRGELENRAKTLVNIINKLLVISLDLYDLWAADLAIATAAIAQESNNYDQKETLKPCKPAILVGKEPCKIVEVKKEQVDKCPSPISDEGMLRLFPRGEPGVVPKGMAAAVVDLEKEECLTSVTGMQTIHTAPATTPTPAPEPKVQGTCDKECEVFWKRMEQENEKEPDTSTAAAVPRADKQAMPEEVKPLEPPLPSSTRTGGKTYVPTGKASRTGITSGAASGMSSEELQKLKKNYWVSKKGIEYRQAENECKEAGIENAQDLNEYDILIQGDGTCVAISKNNKERINKEGLKGSDIITFEVPKDVCDVYAGRANLDTKAKAEAAQKKIVSFLQKLKDKCFKPEGYYYNDRKLETDPSGEKVYDDDGCLVDALTGKVWSKTTGELTDKKDCGPTCCQGISQEERDNFDKVRQQLNSKLAQEEAKKNREEKQKIFENKNGEPKKAGDVKEELNELDSKEHKDEVKDKLTKDIKARIERIDSESKREENNLRQKLNKALEGMSPELREKIVDDIIKNRDIDKLAKYTEIKEEYKAIFEELKGLDKDISELNKKLEPNNLNKLADEYIKVEKLAVMIEARLIKEEDAKKLGYVDKDGNGDLKSMYEGVNGYLDRFKNENKVAENKDRVEYLKGEIEKLEEKGVEPYKKQKENFEKDIKSYNEKIKGINEYKKKIDKDEEYRAFKASGQSLEEFTKGRTDAEKKAFVFKVESYENFLEGRLDLKTGERGKGYNEKLKDYDERLGDLEGRLDEFIQTNAEELGLAEQLDYYRNVMETFEADGKRLEQLKDLEIYLKKGFELETLDALNKKASEYLNGLPDDTPLSGVVPNFLKEEFTKAGLEEIAYGESSQDFMKKSETFRKKLEAAEYSGAVLKSDKEGEEIVKDEIRKADGMIYFRDKSGFYKKAREYELEEKLDSLETEKKALQEKEKEKKITKNERARLSEIESITTELKSALEQGQDMTGEEAEQWWELERAAEARKKSAQEFKEENKGLRELIEKYGETGENLKEKIDALTKDETGKDSTGLDKAMKSADDLLEKAKLKGVGEYLGDDEGFVKAREEISRLAEELKGLTENIDAKDLKDRIDARIKAKEVSDKLIKEHDNLIEHLEGLRKGLMKQGDRTTEAGLTGISVATNTLVNELLEQKRKLEELKFKLPEAEDPGKYGSYVANTFLSSGELEKELAARMAEVKVDDAVRKAVEKILERAKKGGSKYVDNNAKDIDEGDQKTANLDGVSPEAIKLAKEMGIIKWTYSEYRKLPCPPCIGENCPECTRYKIVKDLTGLKEEIDAKLKEELSISEKMQLEQAKKLVEKLSGIGAAKTGVIEDVPDMLNERNQKSLVAENDHEQDELTKNFEKQIAEYNKAISRIETYETGSETHMQKLEFEYKRHILELQKLASIRNKILRQILRKQKDYKPCLGEGKTAEAGKTDCTKIQKEIEDLKEAENKIFDEWIKEDLRLREELQDTKWSPETQAKVKELRQTITARWQAGGTLRKLISRDLAEYMIESKAKIDKITASVTHKLNNVLRKGETLTPEQKKELIKQAKEIGGLLKQAFENGDTTGAISLLMAMKGIYESYKEMGEDTTGLFEFLNTDVKFEIGAATKIQVGDPALVANIKNLLSQLYCAQGVCKDDKGKPISANLDLAAFLPAISEVVDKMGDDINNHYKIQIANIKHFIKSGDVLTQDNPQALSEELKIYAKGYTSSDEELESYLNERREIYEKEAKDWERKEIELYEGLPEEVRKDIESRLNAIPGVPAVAAMVRDLSGEEPIELRKQAVNFYKNANTIGKGVIDGWLENTKKRNELRNVDPLEYAWTNDDLKVSGANIEATKDSYNSLKTNANNKGMTTYDLMGDELRADIKRNALFESFNFFSAKGVKNTKELDMATMMLSGMWDQMARDKYVHEYEEAEEKGDEKAKEYLNFKLGGVDKDSIMGAEAHIMSELAPHLQRMQAEGPRNEFEVKLAAMMNWAYNKARKKYAEVQVKEKEEEAESTLQRITSAKEYDPETGTTTTAADRELRRGRQEIAKYNKNIKALNELIEAGFDPKYLSPESKKELRDMNLVDKENNLGVKDRLIGYDVFGKEIKGYGGLSIDFGGIELEKTDSGIANFGAEMAGMAIDIGFIIASGGGTGIFVKGLMKFKKIASLVNNGLKAGNAAIRLATKAAQFATEVLAESLAFTALHDGMNKFFGRPTEPFLDSLKNNIKMFGFLKLTMGPITKAAKGIAEGIADSPLGRKIMEKVVGFFGEVGAFTAFGTAEEIMHMRSQGLIADPVLEIAGRQFIDNAKFILGLKLGGVATHRVKGFFAKPEVKAKAKAKLSRQAEKYKKMAADTANQLQQNAFETGKLQAKESRLEKRGLELSSAEKIKLENLKAESAELQFRKAMFKWNTFTHDSNNLKLEYGKEPQFKESAKETANKLFENLIAAKEMKMKNFKEADINRMVKDVPVNDLIRESKNEFTEAGKDKSTSGLMDDGIKRVNDAVKDLNGRIKNINEMVERGQITPEFGKKKLNEFRQEQLDLRGQKQSYMNAKLAKAENMRRMLEAKLKEKITPEAGEDMGAALKRFKDKATTDLEAQKKNLENAERKLEEAKGLREIEAAERKLGEARENLRRAEEGLKEAETLEEMSGEINRMKGMVEILKPQAEYAGYEYNRQAIWNQLQAEEDEGRRRELQEDFEAINEKLKEMEPRIEEIQKAEALLKEAFEKEAKKAEEKTKAEKDEIKRMEKEAIELAEEPTKELQNMIEELEIKKELNAEEAKRLEVLKEIREEGIKFLEGEIKALDAYVERMRARKVAPEALKELLETKAKERAELERQLKELRPEVEVKVSEELNKIAGELLGEGITFEEYLKDKELFEKDLEKQKDKGRGDEVNYLKKQAELREKLEKAKPEEKSKIEEEMREETRKYEEKIEKKVEPEKPGKPELIAEIEAKKAETKQKVEDVKAKQEELRKEREKIKAEAEEVAKSPEQLENTIKETERVIEEIEKNLKEIERREKELIEKKEKKELTEEQVEKEGQKLAEDKKQLEEAKRETEFKKDVYNEVKTEKLDAMKEKAWEAAAKKFAGQRGLLETIKEQILRDKKLEGKTESEIRKILEQSMKDIVSYDKAAAIDAALNKGIITEAEAKTLKKFKEKDVENFLKDADAKQKAENKKLIDEGKTFTVEGELITPEKYYKADAETRAKYDKALETKPELKEAFNEYSAKAEAIDAVRRAALETLFEQATKKALITAHEKSMLRSRLFSPTGIEQMKMRSIEQIKDVLASEIETISSKEYRQRKKAAAKAKEWISKDKIEFEEIVTGKVGESLNDIKKANMRGQTDPKKAADVIGEEVEMMKKTNEVVQEISNRIEALEDIKQNAETYKEKLEERQEKLRGEKKEGPQYKEHNKEIDRQIESLENLKKSIEEIQKASPDKLEQVTDKFVTEITAERTKLEQEIKTSNKMADALRNPNLDLNVGIKSRFRLSCKGTCTSEEIKQIEEFNEILDKVEAAKSLENNVDFALRPDQVQNIADWLQNPAKLLEIAVGAGKTDVIIPTTQAAILKLRPEMRFAMALFPDSVLMQEAVPSSRNIFKAVGVEQFVFSSTMTEVQIATELNRLKEYMERPDAKAAIITEQAFVGFGEVGIAEARPSQMSETLRYLKSKRGEGCVLVDEVHSLYVSEKRFTRGGDTNPLSKEVVQAAKDVHNALSELFGETELKLKGDKTQYDYKTEKQKLKNGNQIEFFFEDGILKQTIFDKNGIEISTDNAVKTKRIDKATGLEYGTEPYLSTEFAEVLGKAVAEKIGLKPGEGIAEIEASALKGDVRAQRGITAMNELTRALESNARRQGGHILKDGRVAPYESPELHFSDPYQAAMMELMYGEQGIQNVRTSPQAKSANVRNALKGFMVGGTSGTIPEAVGKQMERQFGTTAHENAFTEGMYYRTKGFKGAMNEVRGSEIKTTKGETIDEIVEAETKDYNYLDKEGKPRDFADRNLGEGEVTYTKDGIVRTRKVQNAHLVEVADPSRGEIGEASFKKSCERGGVEKIIIQEWGPTYKGRFREYTYDPSTGEYKKGKLLSAGEHSDYVRNAEGKMLDAIYEKIPEPRAGMEVVVESKLGAKRALKYDAETKQWKDIDKPIVEKPEKVKVEGPIKVGAYCKVETGTDFKLPESARNAGLVGRTTSDLTFRQMMARARTVYKYDATKKSWEKIDGEFHSKDIIFVEGKDILGELTGFERVNKFREFTLRNEAEFIDVEGAKAYKLTAENLAQGIREIPKDMMDLGSEFVKESTLPETAKTRLIEELQGIASSMEGGEVLQSTLRGGEKITSRQKLLEEARNAQAKVKEARDKLKESGAYNELPKEFRELLDEVADRPIKESDLEFRGGREGKLNAITPHERLKQISDFYSEKEITKNYEETRRAPAEMLTRLIEAAKPAVTKPTKEAPAPVEAMVRGEVKAVEYKPERKGFVTAEGEFVRPVDVTPRSFNSFKEGRREEPQVLIPSMQDRYDVPTVVRDKDTGAYYQAALVDNQYVLTDKNGDLISITLDELKNYEALTSAKEVEEAIKAFEVESMAETAIKLRNKMTEDNIGENKERIDDLLILEELAETSEEKAEIHHKIDDVVYAEYEQLKGIDVVNNMGWINAKTVKDKEQGVFAFASSFLSSQEAKAEMNENKEAKELFGKMKKVSDDIADAMRIKDETKRNEKLKENVNKLLNIVKDNKENIDVQRTAMILLTPVAKEEAINLIDSAIKETKVEVEESTLKDVIEGEDIEETKNIIAMGRNNEEKKEEVIRRLEVGICS